jgi:hypothetical protein
MAVLKKPIKKPVEKDEIPMFHEGDKAYFIDDGKDYHGEITEVDGDKLTIKVDEDSYQVTVGEDEIHLEKTEKKLKTPLGGAKAKAKPAGKADDFADAFNKVNAAVANTGGLPPGKHKCAAVELGLRDSDKGLSGFIKYTVMDNDDEANEKSGVSFYQLLNEAGEEQEGFGYFKRDLILLGMDEDTQLTRRSDLEEMLEDIAKKEMYVEVTVREKGGFTNIFLNEVLDQDDKP